MRVGLLGMVDGCSEHMPMSGEEFQQNRSN